jgi:hypothetical protein
VAYYQAPAPQIVTVVAGQTLMVTGTYTIVAFTPGDVLLDSFAIGAGPFLPNSDQAALMYVTNPTGRVIQYRMYVYPTDPTWDVNLPGLNAIGEQVFALNPGQQSSFWIGVTMPGQEGLYPIWLRFYEEEPIQGFTFIKKVNTGRVVTVATVPPPPPPEWPIIQQVASIAANLVDVWSMVYPQQLYDPYNLPASDLQEMLVGQQYTIEVVLPSVLSYGGKTWNLAQGQNLIVW